MRGGIENTKFGKDLLEADIVLKKMGLGKLRTDIWGVKSYFDMSFEEWEKTGKENEITSRFWFVPSKEESFVGVRRGVAIVDRLRITVKTEVISSPRKRDEIGEKFSMMVASNFDDLSSSYAPLRRLDPLFRLTGLAEGINRWHSNNGKLNLPNLHFWLDEYKVSKVKTPREYPLKKNERILEKNGCKKKLTIDGGIKLKVLILELQDKVIDALKEIVIKSRPNGNSLTWEIPLEAWGKPEIAESAKFKKRLQNLPISRKLGMSLNVHFSEVGRPFKRPSFHVNSTPLSENGESYFNFVSKLPDSFKTHKKKNLKKPILPRPDGKQSSKISNFPPGPPPPPPPSSTPLPLPSDVMPHKASDDKPGGVKIDPTPSMKGKGGTEIKKKVLESRPSDDVLFWSVEITKKNGLSKP